LTGYSFLGSLGKKFGLSAMAAAHLCKRNEIEVRYVELRDENRKPFIHNVYRKKFIEAVKRRLLALEPNINQGCSPCS
jgi:mannosyltransferase OCH1-like enzyme